MSSSRAIVAAALLAIACQRPAPISPPAPSAVEPTAAHTSADVPIVIHGDDFLLTGTRRVGAGIEVDGTFQAWLGTTPLRDVVWVDDRTLKAVVPAGLAGDPLDLTVDGPGGRATLAAAFRASPLSAPDLSAALTAPAQIEAGQPFTLSAQVANAGEQAVSGLGVRLQGAADPLWQSGPGGAFDSSLILPGPGLVSLAVEATATDSFAGTSVTAVSPPVSVRVLAGPHLKVVSHALPATVDLGQELGVAVDVINDGDADALALQWSIPAAPNVILAGTAAAPSDVPAGATRTFSWPMQAVAAGAFALSAAGSATDPLTGLPLPVMSDWATVLAQSPPSLAAAMSAPAIVSAGQRIVVTVEVTNGGDADVDGVVAALDPGTLFAVVAAPGPANVAGHATQRFDFQLDALAAGLATLKLAVQGLDVNTGAPVGAAPQQSAVLVQSPASLATTSPSAAQVSTQQVFSVAVQVTNPGQATALGVAPGTPACSGAGGLQLLSQSTAQDLAGGATGAVVWTWRGAVNGAVDCTLPVAGHDANSATLVGASAAFHVVVQVQAALSIESFSAPAALSSGQSFVVTMLVRNTGQATASGVSPTPPAVGAGGSAAASTATAPAPVSLAGGASTMFQWVFVESGSGHGTVSISGTAVGVDVNSGAAIPSPAAASASATVQVPATLHIDSFTAPAAIDSGQDFVATLTVRNSGEADALAVLPAPPAIAAAGSASASTSSAPSPADIPGGSTAIFSWTFHENGAGAGTLQLSAGASGSDANSGYTVSAAPVSSSPIDVQRPAALSVTSLTLPPSLSRGQAFNLTMTVRNTGGATATGVAPLAPALVSTGGAHASTASVSAPVSLPGGASTTFTWSYVEDGTARGTLAFASQATGTDANTGSAIASAQATSDATAVQEPAALSITSIKAPASVDRGQTFQVSVVVSNTGEAAAWSVTPSPNPPAVAAAGGAAAAASAVAGTSIAGGSSATFAFTFTENGTGTGSLSFTAGAAGVDANSGAPIGGASATASSAVQNRAALAVTSFTLRSAHGSSTINRGQGFIASMTVANTGDAAAIGVLPSPPSVSATGGAAATTSSVPAAATISGGSSTTFDWTFVECGTSAGTLRIASSAAGTDANDGASTSTGPAQSDLTTVQEPAALSATVSAPLLVILLQTFTVSLQVTNGGDGAVNGLAPASFSIGGAATTVLSGPTPASATLAGHGTVTFSWTCQANAIGAIAVYGSASGTDANDGSTRFTSASTSATVTEVQQISSDPFADGTSSSYVFDFNGRVYLGPNKGGTGGVRMLPDGSAVENVTFTFNNDAQQKDANTYNGGASPYPSLGFTGCTRNTAQCGPDNEDGRGMYGSGVIAGSPWLIASGSVSGGNLAHVYATTDTMTAPDFDYIGVKSQLGGEVQGTSAMAVFHDRIYLGLPSAKSNRPFLLVINTTPPTPGFDATNTDAINLQSTKMPGMGASGSPKNNASTQLIDSFGVFNDRLYLGNNGGWMRTTTNAPGSYQGSPSDWAVATPSAAAYGAKTSVTTSKLADLLPADRAVPQWAVLNGKLYAARNTTAGPQIWACTPGSDLACDPGDWALIAPNTSGDSQLSQFNDPDNASVSLLVATPSHLYIGFDDATDGVRLYRSSTTAPLALSDFQGQGSCSASAGSASCPGRGGNGLGAGVTRIFDGRALSYGGAGYLYLTAGTGTGGVSVFRVPE